MGRNPRHTEQVRAQNAARNAATRELVRRHPEEYRALYVAEAEKLGIEVKPWTGLVTKKHKVAPLEAEIRASGVLDGVDVPPKPTKYLLENRPEHEVFAFQQETRQEQLLRYEARTSAVPPLPGSESEKPAPPPSEPLPQIPEAPW